AYSASPLCLRRTVPRWRADQSRVCLAPAWAGGHLHRERRLGGLCAAVRSRADQPDLDLCALAQLLQVAAQIVHIGHWLVVELVDHIAGMNARKLGGATLDDLDDLHRHLFLDVELAA